MTGGSSRLGRARAARLGIALVLWAAAGCESPRPRVTRDSARGEAVDTAKPPSPRLATDATLAILSDGSVAPVMRVLSDSFSTREAVQVRRESTEGSALSDELKRIPDILVLADTALSHLPSAAQATWYVRFVADSLTGRPIVHGVSIPRNAANPQQAERFIRFVLSSDGGRILRAAHLDPLRRPILVGNGAPPAIVALITATGGANTEELHDTASKAR
jgi:hypothetical protein